MANGLVGQPRHVVALVADEEVAADASQQRRAESLGDFQMMDDDLGLGDGGVVAGFGQQGPSFFGHRMPVEDGAHAQFDVEADLRRVGSHGVQIAVAERGKGGELEEHALQAKPVAKSSTPSGSSPEFRVV